MLFSLPTLWYSSDYMDSPLTLSTWNIKGALSDPRRVETALEAIQATEADIITLADAWHEDSAHSLPTSRELLVSPADLRKQGYTALKATFREQRPDDNYATYGFMTLIRDTINPSYEEVRLMQRPAHHLQVDLGARALHVVSLYLNDESEMNRAMQIQGLLHHLSGFDLEPAVLMGDFNAMHRHTHISSFLQAPGLGAMFNNIPLMNNTLPRLWSMASGNTMKLLEINGFTDADPKHTPTMPSRFPLFQLDHIMTRGGVGMPLHAARPTRRNYPDISDHVLLTTKLTVE